MRAALHQGPKMFEAINRIASIPALDDLARSLWAGLASGELSEDAAQAISEAIEARRTHLRGTTRMKGQKAASGLPRPSKGHPRSPDREASIRRRRTLAASGLIPATIAARFTVGEAAALAVVAVEVMRRGHCVLCLDRIAALAGVSRTTAQTAFRIAARLGIISVTERRQPGWRSLPNIIRITDKSWAGWIAYRHRVQKTERHVEQEEHLKAVDKVSQQAPEDAFTVRSWHTGTCLNRSPDHARRRPAHQSRQSR